MFFTIPLFLYCFSAFVYWSFASLLAMTPLPDTFWRSNVAFVPSPLPSSFLSSTSLPPPITQVVSSEGDDRGMLTSPVLTLHSAPLRYICALTGGRRGRVTDGLHDWHGHVTNWQADHCLAAFCCLAGCSANLPPPSRCVAGHGRLAPWHCRTLLPITLLLWWTEGRWMHGAPLRQETC